MTQLWATAPAFISCLITTPIRCTSLMDSIFSSLYLFSRPSSPAHVTDLRHELRLVVLEIPLNVRRAKEE